MDQEFGADGHRQRDGAFGGDGLFSNCATICAEGLSVDRIEQFARVSLVRVNVACRRRHIAVPDEVAHSGQVVGRARKVGRPRVSEVVRADLIDFVRGELALLRGSERRFTKRNPEIVVSEKEPDSGAASLEYLACPRCER